MPPVPAEQPQGRVTVDPQTPGIRIGVGAKGLIGTDRLKALLQANQSSDPSQKVVDSGDFIDVLPKKKMGRFQAALGQGLGEIAGAYKHRGSLSGGDLVAWELGRGAGGFGSGLINPDAFSKTLRDKEINQLQGQIGQSLDLDEQQAKIDKMNRPEGEDRPLMGDRVDPETGETVETIWNPKTRSFDDALGPSNSRVVRKPKPSEKPTAETVDVTVNGRTFKVTPAQAASIEAQREAVGRGQEDKGAQREGKRKAATVKRDAASQAESAARAQVTNLDAQLEKERQGLRAGGLSQDDADAIKGRITDLVGQRDRALGVADGAMKEKNDALSELAGLPEEPKAAPDARKGTINKVQQQRWLTDNPGKTLDDMRKLYPNAKIIE